MVRVASILLGIAVLIAVLFATNDGWNLSAVETFTAVVLIVAFGIAATGWTIRHDI
jgi:uncharacterized membrane protein YqjE